MYVCMYVKTETPKNLLYSPKSEIFASFINKYKSFLYSFQTEILAYYIKI